MEVTKPITLDILETGSPKLSTNSDMPVIETKPDAKKPIGKEVTAAPAKDKTDASKTNSESATEQTDEQSGEPEEAKKPARGVQKKLDELTRREADALRIADSGRQENLRLLALLEAKGKPEPVKNAVTEGAPVRPNKADFTDPDAYDSAVDDYIDARAEWKAKAEVETRMESERKAVETRQIEEGQKAAREAYSVRVEKTREKYPDYSEVAESPNVQVSIPVAHAILHSEHGPDIAYHLGKNPAEASRIFALNPALQLMELGLIVAKLQGPDTSVQVVTTKPPVTKAPPPGKRLDAGSDASTKSIEDMSVEEYAEHYRQRPENRRRPGMRQ